MQQIITIVLQAEESKELLETIKFLKAFVETYDPTPSSSRGYLNIEEASNYTGISVDTLYQYTSQRKIPFMKPGKHLIFDPLQLDVWLKQHRKEVL